MASAADKLLKELLAIKAKALAAGVKAVGPVITAVAEAEPEESDPNVPVTSTRTLVVGNTLDYLDALKKLPRQLLEARYRQDVGLDCPPAPREWLIEKMARKAQREAYLKFEGVVPESVKRNDARFDAVRPRLFNEDDDLDDNEPGKDERKFDPTMRAKALIPNPFSRGLAYQLFMLVESQKDGIQYRALVLLIKTMNDRAQDWAERKVQKVFTKWVDRGWVELV